MRLYFRFWLVFSLVVGSLLGFSLASYADTGGFQDLATFTNSATSVTGHLCGAYGNADIGCAATSPYVSSGGLVGIGTESPAYPLDVSGTVRAAAFVGDGSGLTNVVASTADRIVSGTTSMLAVSATGLISITQNGVNTAYFHPSLGLVTVGVSSTGAIKATSMYAGNFGTSGSLVYRDATGLLTGDPSITVVASGTLMVPYLTGYSLGFTSVNAVNLAASQNATVAGTVTAGFFVGDGSGLTNLPISTDRLVSGTASVVLGSDGTLAVQNMTAWGVGVTALRALNVSVTDNLSAVGDVTAAHFIGDGSQLTNLPSQTPDKIVSGSVSLVANGTSGVIKASGAVQVSGSGVESCTSGSDRGKVRVDPVSRRFQICKWYE